MEIINNPYIKPLHDAIIAKDKEKIAELQEKARHFLQESIRSCEDKITDLINHSNFPDYIKEAVATKRVTYKDYVALKNLHKEAKEITKQIGDVKINVLHELKK